jgi:hypothetical protein
VRKHASIISEPSLGKVSSERIANQRDCGGQIAEHQLCADADDAEARAAELQITAGVRAALARVDGAIDFNDELDGGSEEVSDEADKRDLAAKRDAELARVDGGPEERFRRCGLRAMLTSEDLKARLSLEICRRTRTRVSLQRRQRAGRSPQAQAA